MREIERLNSNFAGEYPLSGPLLIFTTLPVKSEKVKKRGLLCFLSREKEVLKIEELGCIQKIGTTLIRVIEVLTLIINWNLDEIIDSSFNEEEQMEHFEKLSYQLPSWFLNANNEKPDSKKWDIVSWLYQMSSSVRGWEWYSCKETSDGWIIRLHALGYPYSMEPLLYLINLAGGKKVKYIDHDGKIFYSHYEDIN
jgi:hypothetical protein